MVVLRSKHITDTLPRCPEFGHFWQHRYYDFNVRNSAHFMEKLRYILRYIHRNPVMRGLCEHPEQWEWSSCRHYAAGTATPSNCPIQANKRIEWAPALQAAG
jgi:putative transposase